MSRNFETDGDETFLVQLRIRDFQAITDHWTYFLPKMMSHDCDRVNEFIMVMIIVRIIMRTRDDDDENEDNNNNKIVRSTRWHGTGNPI